MASPMLTASSGPCTSPSKPRRVTAAQSVVSGPSGAESEPWETRTGSEAVGQGGR